MKHREHIVQSGDSLERLALLYYNDARRWQEIADYNNLQYPYLTAVSIGRRILIPTQASADQVPPSSVEEWVDELVGEDADGTSTGASDVYGDAVSAIGLENMKQAIEHRLMTQRGELVYHPEYGSNLDTLVGRTEPFIVKKITLDVIETIRQDDRIATVRVENLRREGLALYLDCHFTLVGQETLFSVRLALPFDGR